MLSVESISFAVGRFSVDHLTFNVSEGCYFFILGQSGSGKSLTLEALAGLRKVKSGLIRLDQEDITYKPLNKRNIGLVFQSLALFPHLTVNQNIAFPLKTQKMESEERQHRVQTIAERLSISGILDRKPGSLSGGEHQRVALARTLVMQPKVLLLDEPLSSLDILLKDELMDVLKSIHQSGQTIIHVTHDYHEVKQLADQIAIMENGKIIQAGTREEIIRQPRCRLAQKLV